MSETETETAPTVQDGLGRSYRHFPLTLPALPTLALTVAVEQGAADSVWFPVKPICEDGLGIDAYTQQRKLQAPEGDYEGRWRLIPFPTAKGYRETVALEWEAVGQWLLGIQAARIGNDEVRDWVALFQRQAFNAMQRILAGRVAAPAARGGLLEAEEPLGSSRALTSRPRGRDAVLAHLRERVDLAEARLAVILEVQGKTPPVFPVGGGAGDVLATRVAHCPHCGQALELRVGSLEVVEATDTGQE